MNGRVQEFVCCECGRSICRIVHQDTLGLCAECLHMPGWFNVPEIRDVFDPSYADDVAAGRLASTPSPTSP